MWILVLSLAALAAGPLVHRLAGRASEALSALDGFVTMAISGLVVVHIVPHAIESAGMIAIVVAIAGLVGPGLVERTLHRAADSVHTATLVLAVAGLVLHGFFDGVGLAGPEAPQGGPSMLAIAVLLHRLPVGITLWWLLLPRLGTARSAMILVGMGAATAGGYGLADVFADSLDAAWVGVVQALIAGSVLHVILHRPPTPAQTHGSRQRLAAGVGALFGIAAVAALSSEHIGEAGGDHVSRFGSLFLTLALESAPALLLAFALAGIAQMVLPTLPKRWMRSTSSTGEAFRGVAFGMPLPICSCGVVPLYRTLITQSVPATAAMAFLVATPELGLDAILISLPLLGPEMTIIRVAGAVALALAIGVIVGRVAQRRSADESVDEVPKPPSGFVPKLRAGLAFGFGEIVDHTGPWLLLGVAIAAIVAPVFESAWITALPFGVDVLFFTLIGLPAYVCASGATPLVAVLLLQGVSPGAALAFLLAGPATNVTTFGVLASLHGRRVAALFALAMTALAVALGIAVNLLADGVIEIEPPTMHDEHGLFAILCLVALAAIFALSILRQGPRSFIGQILSPFDLGDGHDHGHDHHHHHH